MGNNEQLAAKALEVSGNVNHYMISTVGAYRQEKLPETEYIDEACERVFRWLISKRKHKEVVTLDLLKAAEHRFMAEEEAEVLTQTGV